MKQLADKVDQEILPLMRQSKVTRDLLAAQARALEEILGVKNASPPPKAKEPVNGVG